MDTPQQYPTMWTTGYLKNGMKVSFTFPVRDPMNAYGEALAITSKLLADGFATEDPAFGKLEAGEYREKVNGVLRRNYMEDDGSIVPVIDIYPDNPALGRRCVFYYLNDEQQIAEFEAATGLKLATMPVYSEPQLNRTEKPQIAQKFIMPVTGNVSVVFRDNPAYDANAAKKKAKHFFVRWESANVVTPTPPALPATVQPVGIPTGNPPPVGEETELRIKARTALNNELVTIYKCTYSPTHNGMGAPSWTAYAHDINDTSFPITVGERGVKLIKKAGYEWPSTDGKDMDIPVITAVAKNSSKRYIQSVQALDGTMIAEMPREPLETTPEQTVGAWAVDLPALYKELGQRASDVNSQERINTVQKMYREGDFANVGTLEGAVTMVVERLKKHHAKKDAA